MADPSRTALAICIALLLIIIAGGLIDWPESSVVVRPTPPGD